MPTSWVSASICVGEWLISASELPQCAVATCSTWALNLGVDLIALFFRSLVIDYGGPSERSQPGDNEAAAPTAPANSSCVLSDHPNAPATSARSIPCPPHPELRLRHQSNLRERRAEAQIRHGHGQGLRLRAAVQQWAPSGRRTDFRTVQKIPHRTFGDPGATRWLPGGGGQDDATAAGRRPALLSSWSGRRSAQQAPQDRHNQLLKAAALRLYPAERPPATPPDAEASVPPATGVRSRSEDPQA